MGKTGDGLMAVPRLSTFTQNRKRKHTLDDSDNTPVHRNGISKPGLRAGPNHRLHKRTRTTTRIQGQPLPVGRMLEVLDHQSLQTMLTQLVAAHPEIQETVSKLSPPPRLDNSIKLLRDKYDDMVSHLPYKCDTESDYSYLRVKGLLMEFFHCLSDLILAYLPPVETSMEKSLLFLHEATELIHALPNFTNSEFQYTKNMAYEQVANTWLIVLQQDDVSSTSIANGANGSSDVCVNALPSPSGSSSDGMPSESEVESNEKLIKVVEGLDLVSKLEHHDETSRGKFKHIMEFIKHEQEMHDQLMHHLASESSSYLRLPNRLLNEFITVDYSNYSISARSSH